MYVLESNLLVLSSNSFAFYPYFFLLRKKNIIHTFPMRIVEEKSVLWKKDSESVKWAENFNENIKLIRWYFSTVYFKYWEIYFSYVTLYVTVLIFLQRYKFFY